MGVLGSLTVVSPDSGRIRTAERWANRLGGVPIAFIHKTRDPPTKTIKANRVVGDVTGAPASSSTRSSDSDSSPERRNPCCLVQKSY